MKKVVLAVAIAFSLTSCWSRIGKLVIVSNRNMDSKTDYVLLAKDVKGKAKSKKYDVIGIAVDNAVKQYPTGEFMKNISIEANKSGKKVRVNGDVWGTAPQINNTVAKTGEIVNKNVTKSVNANVEFKTGDKASFKNMMGKIIEGTIIGLNQSTAIIEQADGSKTEIKYEKLTKIERQ